MVKIVKPTAKRVMRKRPAAAALLQPASKRPTARGSQQLSAPSPKPPPALAPVLPDWYGESNEESQNQVYLVTAAKLVNEKEQVEHVGEQAPPPLKDPASISKLEFRTALQDSIANPIRDRKRGGRPSTRTLELDVYMGVMEGELGKQHHHAALKLFDANHRFLPFKAAMRWRHGIATHWSTSHTQLWSTVRYLHCTTAHKPAVDRRPELWTRDGRKLNLHDEAQEPFQAGAWNKKRENRMSEPFAKKPKKDGFNKMDFTAIVLQHRLLTPNAVLTYMMTKGSKAFQLWAHCKQRKLKEFIQDALDMENAKPALALEKETEWALVERLSRGTCKCGDDGCFWWSLALEFFKNNNQIDRQRLAASLRKIMSIGPCKEARVPTIIGEPNCAKSTVLDPIRTVFGKAAVLGKPKLGAANGALSKMAKGDIRFVYFDDYRPVDYAAHPKENPTVPVTDFLALFCGQPFNIQVSQSFNDGHPDMEYHKGAAMTAKEEGLWDPIGNVTREEIRHMQARVEIFRATHVVGKNPDDFDHSPECAASWCRWIVVDSVAFAARQGPSNFPGGAPRRPRRGAALPALGATQPANNNAGSTGRVSAQQMVDIAQRRAEAVRRKLERQQRAMLPGMPDDDEDALGLGTSLD